MTAAVCIKCGCLKFGAWTPCAECGHVPETLLDRAKNLLLTDHYFSRSELGDFSRIIAFGSTWPIDSETTHRFVDQFAQAEYQDSIVDQSWDLIEEYRQTLDQNHRDFFDELEDFTQAVDARLWLYQRYSNRVTAAGEMGGWLAAEAEFQRVLTEEPRLQPLRIQQWPNSPDHWIVIHPDRPT